MTWSVVYLILSNNQLLTLLSMFFFWATIVGARGSSANPIPAKTNPAQQHISNFPGLHLFFQLLICSLNICCTNFVKRKKMAFIPTKRNYFKKLYLCLQTSVRTSSDDLSLLWTLKFNPFIPIERAFSFYFIMYQNLPKTQNYFVILRFCYIYIYIYIHAPHCPKYYPCV